MSTETRLPEFPVKGRNAGARVAAAMIGMPIFLMGAWEFFSPGSPVLLPLLVACRLLTFVTVFVLLAFAIAGTDD